MLEREITALTVRNVQSALDSIIAAQEIAVASGEADYVPDYDYVLCFAETCTTVSFQTRPFLSIMEPTAWYVTGDTAQQLVDKAVSLGAEYHQ